MRASCLGSSPLSRGILAHFRRVVSGRRIIPALAGNTVWFGWGGGLWWDHPRSRGEYYQQLIRDVARGGSSPLSRGILLPARWYAKACRIIPALAGNTLSRRGICVGREDHPRSRGEYGSWQIESSSGPGSSPLSRGILPLNQAALYRVGIIPALAGNTPYQNSAPHPRTDHPRSRGEYPVPVVNRGLSRGSSPLSRGIRPGPQRPCRAARIIPALAGNTGSSFHSFRLFGDHPRSRGEYIYPKVLAWSVEGSSPLSRGIPAHWWSRAEDRRIIPALAGNTLAASLPEWLPSDHPRSRGEYTTARGLIYPDPGSSPLSRGIRHGFGTFLPPTRIIPALAGNTSALSA